MRPSKTLLVALVMLLAIRFVWLPWTEWSDTARSELQVLTQRLDRSVGVVENGIAIRAAERDLTKRHTELRAMFRTEEDPEAFKLAAQRDVSTWSAEAGVRLDVFDWVVSDDDPPGQQALRQVRARIQLSGQLRSLALLHGRFESSMPYAVIRENRVRPVNSADGAADSPASMTLVIDFFHLAGKADG